MLFSTVLSLLILLAAAQYELQSSFYGLTFFDNFEFYTSWDPTYGYVHYVDQAVAQQLGMVTITNTSVFWGVDTTQLLNPSANLGRPSIRLISLQSWTHGLFILDLAHMPSNTCGVWPALWMLGSGLWPTTGEIDIIEYVNNEQNDLMALHTTEACTVAGADETGTLITSDCGAGGGFTGCTVAANQPNNAGAAFNANGGGVYAMEWTSTWIRIWFFPRNAIPTSIGMGSPNVEDFGTPAANFEGDCDIDAHFYNHSMIFDIDFCGSYAGNVWESNGCPMLDPENGWSSCNEFVALNPSAFGDTYWEVNYLNIYQANGAISTSTRSLSSITPAISTSTAASTVLSGAEGRTTTLTMSLAGTTPTITTGFSATSSVLSVLSSLSTESEASASSVWSSLVGRATSTSPLSSSSISTLPFSTAPTTTAELTSIPVSTSSSVVSQTPPSTTASIEPPGPCTGLVCTSNVYVTVVQTITVGAIAARKAPTSTLPLNAAQTSNSWDQFDLCNFEIIPATRPKSRWTDFGCTLTRAEIFNGELATETFIASTAIQADTALQFGELLVIDKIFMQTRGITNLTQSGKHTLTGSFTPSGTYLKSTTLTAHLEVLTTSTKPISITKSPYHVVQTLQNDQTLGDAAAGTAINQEGLAAQTETSGQTYTNHTTKSKIQTDISPGLSTSVRNPQGSVACSRASLSMLLGLSLLAALKGLG